MREAKRTHAYHMPQRGSEAPVEAESGSVSMVKSEARMPHIVAPRRCPFSRGLVLAVSNPVGVAAARREPVTDAEYGGTCIRCSICWLC